MSEMTDIWGLSNGFSHQIVQIYGDQGEHPGRVDVDGRQRWCASWAWRCDRRSRRAGRFKPCRLRPVAPLPGRRRLVNVDSKTITFTVSKGVIGSDIPNYRYIVVIGSQDGLEPVKAGRTAQPYVDAGGGENPAPDGIDYDPNIIDVILEAEGQTSMLSYDVAGHTYAQLTGFEMPEVPQQLERRWTRSPPLRSSPGRPPWPMRPPSMLHRPVKTPTRPLNRCGQQRVQTAVTSPGSRSTPGQRATSMADRRCCGLVQHDQRRG